VGFVFVPATKARAVEEGKTRGHKNPPMLGHSVSMPLLAAFFIFI
jgi:hypothetical protein